MSKPLFVVLVFGFGFAMLGLSGCTGYVGYGYGSDYYDQAAHVSGPVYMPGDFGFYDGGYHGQNDQGANGQGQNGQ